jgi:hypothetical protein
MVMTRWRRDLLVIALAVAAVVLWRGLQSYPTGVFDLYPLYWGGKAWLATGDAYNLAAVVPPDQHGYQLYRVGNIYPLPAVLLILPLTLLAPQSASLVWIGLLTGGLLLVLRLQEGPWWFALTLPIVEGLRIEQYTPAMLSVQLCGLWAVRTRRSWLVGVCVAVLLTKPNQAVLFGLLLVLVGRAWRASFVAVAVLWGGSLLLDPHWVAAWLPTLVAQRSLLQQPILWPLALFAVPLLWWRDWTSAAVVAQFALLPWSGIYAAGALPLGILHRPRAYWYWPLSWLWLVGAAFLGQPLAVGLLLVVPVVLLSGGLHLSALRQLIARASPA